MPYQRRSLTEISESYLRTYITAYTVSVSIKICRSYDDIEEKWVVVPDGMDFSDEEIAKQVHFQEQFFNYAIKR